VTIRGVGVHAAGRWNPGIGTLTADDLVIESPRSNMRGIVSLKSVAESSVDLRLDSAGIQAADMLDWYRAFRPGVSEDIRAEQYFTGAATFRGWPLSLRDAAFPVLAAAGPFQVFPRRSFRVRCVAESRCAK